MATDCISQLTLKFQQKMKPVVARFDTEHASTDGGAILLKALDERLALTEDLAACLPDRRDPRKVQHELRDLVRQRVFGLACGYEDGNDAARLAHDPMHKLAVGRDPLTGAPWPRSRRCLDLRTPWARGCCTGWARTLADRVIEQHRHRLKGRARRITIDLDPTDDPTHGQQELAFFNGHYDTWCYLPLVATLTFNDEAEQYLVAIVLRPGNSPAKQGAVGLVRALLRRLRRAFPGTPLRVRVDGGFAGNDWLDVLEAEQVEYVVGLANNPRLEQRAGRLLGEAYGLSKYSGRTEHVYGETLYAAQDLVASSASPHQGRGGAAAGARPEMQSALCGHQSDGRPCHGVCGLLSAGGHGESAQGVARWAGAGPNELLAVLGQSVPRAADGHGLRAAAGVAAAGRRHRLRPCAGVHVAGAAAQDWPCGSNARCGASCCTCPARRPGARPGTG